MKRPERLKFKGGTDASGQPVRFFAAVPARDLGALDIAALTDEQIKDITGGDDPLYVDPDAERKPAAKKASAKRDDDGAHKHEGRAVAKTAPAAPARLDDEPAPPVVVPLSEPAGDAGG